MKKNNFLAITILILNSNYIHTAQIKEKSKKLKQTEQEKLDKALFDNTSKGNFEEVQKLLQQGAQPDGFKGKRNETPLYAIVYQTLYALQKMSEEKMLEYQNIAKLLIDSGADVNAKSNCGDSILSRAFRTQSIIKLYDLLIQNGANINIQDRYGRTILMDILSDSIPDLNLPGAIALADQFKTESLPKFLNIILFDTDFTYDLDILDNDGRSVYDYANKLPKAEKNWVLAELESYKKIKNKLSEHINRSIKTNECLEKELPPALTNMVQQYLGYSKNTTQEEPEQKEKEE